MDIIQDINTLQIQITRYKSAWKSIEEQLELFTQHWPVLCEQYFAQAASIKKSEAAVWQMDGQVLGKPFSVRATPLAMGDAEKPKLYAELVITVPKLNGEAVELSRMMIDRDSELFSLAGEKLLGNHDEYASYKLFASLINAVLRAKAA